jgi:hypothetical protein
MVAPGIEPGTSGFVGRNFDRKTTDAVKYQYKYHTSGHVPSSGPIVKGILLRRLGPETEHSISYGPI